MSRVALFSLVLLPLAAGCARKENARAADTTAQMAPAPPAAARVASVDGFSTPESVKWDAEQSVWFVSNINGSPVAKDGNGFISRLHADGTIDSLHFIQGGRDGVRLNGPKGLAIQGDTLWVADIDAVRGFDRHTGAPVASIELGSRARFLNDIVAAPDGSLYVTDTGLAMENGQLSHPGPDRIFRIKGRQATVAAEGPWLAGPNGITLDPAGARFIVVPYNGTELLGWRPGDSTVDTVATGPGGQDGVEFLKGRLLFSSWADSTIFAVDNSGVDPVVQGVPSPADIGVDPVRNWIAVPIFLGNRVEFWHLP